MCIFVLNCFTTFYGNSTFHSLLNMIFKVSWNNNVFIEWKSVGYFLGLTALRVCIIPWVHFLVSFKLFVPNPQFQGIFLNLYSLEKLKQLSKIWYVHFSFCGTLILYVYWQSISIGLFVLILPTLLLGLLIPRALAGI